jgi:hypothetical protein
LDITFGWKNALRWRLLAIALDVIASHNIDIKRLISEWRNLPSARRASSGMRRREPPICKLQAIICRVSVPRLICRHAELTSEA